MLLKDKYNKKTKEATSTSEATYIEMSDTKSRESILDKGIKLSIITGILMTSFSVFYHYMFFIPQLEEKKATKQFDSELAKLKEEKEIERIRFNTEKQRHQSKIYNMKQCLEAVDKTYNDNLVNACKSYGLDTRDENCTLPNYHIAHTEKTRVEGREVCLKLYGGGTL